MRIPGHPRTFFSGTLLLLGIVLLTPGCAASRKAKAGAWQNTRWHGETAWVADSGEWRAIVSTDRARLIYIGPKTGGTNLLYAPPLPVESFRPRGGHLFWLGPQDEWNGRWGAWPPPAEWEQHPAASVQADGPRLSLTHPRPDKNRPQLTRSYRWDNDVLLCEVSWSEGSGDHQAIQILQLPLHATVEARRLSETVPGFVRFDTKGKQGFEPDVLGKETVLSSAGTVLLTAGNAPSKFGFRPHILDARIGDCGLELGRVDLRGVIVNAPDRGFETQVFLGDATCPFVEIEQLTPRLKNRGATPNAFTLSLKPRRLAPSR